MSLEINFVGVKDALMCRMMKICMMNNDNTHIHVYYCLASMTLTFKVPTFIFFFIPPFSLYVENDGFN